MGRGGAGRVSTKPEKGSGGITAAPSICASSRGTQKSGRGRYGESIG